MKKTYILFLLFFFFIFVQTNFSQDSWTWQNPIPHSNSYNASLHVAGYLKDDRVLAVSNSSSITEFNSAVEQMHVNSSIDFITDIKFNPIQNKIGVLSYNIKLDGTYNPNIFTKGGTDKDWNLYVPPASFGYISGFDFYGQTIVTAGQDGGIEYSTDNGTKWKLVKIDLAGGEFRGIKIIREDHWQAYGDNSGIENGILNGTTDLFDVGEPTINFKGNYSFRDAYYGGFKSTPSFYKQNHTHTSADSLIVIVGTKGIAVRSTDGGFTFDSLNTGVTDDLYGVDFSDLMHGIAVGYSGTIIYTTDGGDTWSVGASNFSSQLNSVSYKTVDSAYAFGDNGIVLLTTDGGSTWNEISSGVRSWFESMFFTDKNTGFVVGRGDDGKAQILKTTNGGETWVINFEDFKSFTFNSIYFVDKDTGYAAGEFEGGFFKTTDGGNSWNKSSLQGYQEFKQILFTDANTGYAVGGYAALKTTNAGATWDTMNTNSASNISSVSFPSKDVGYIGGDGVIKTTNGGEDWASLSLQPSFSIIASIFFINENKGFCVYGGTVAKTTDGGNTWDETTLSTLDDFYCVSFIDSSTGFIIGLNYYGSSSPIYKTTDGGDTWTLMNNAPTSNTLKSIFFTDTNTGYLAGYAGTILKTTNAGEITSVKISKRKSSPVDFMLYQNYPNPFNPTTKIKYSIPSVGTSLMKFLQLKVYNILGREIATLVNKQQPPGNYEVEFDASKLSSGVYFYRLTTGSFVETKKMILLK